MTEAGNSTITDYLTGGFQYSNSFLQFFPHVEGYVTNVLTSSICPTCKYKPFYSLNYVFNYTDHLGNVRVSYAQENGNLKILEENSYYPFGLKHTRNNLTSKMFVQSKGTTSLQTIAELTTSTSYFKNNYKYNGKELQDELGLNMYDYGARLYDPARAGWSNIDPLAEKMRRFSPYNYCFDNPLRFTDPDGMSPNDIVFFNRQGEETHRIQSNTVFKTYVENGPGKVDFTAPYIGYTEAQMPNIIQTRVDNKGRVEDVSGSKYQVNDYQIAASTYLTNQELNSGFMQVVNRGGNFIPSSNLESVSDVSVDKVKAWSMQETHAGTDNGSSGILQVNVGGDYTKDKIGLGITKGAVFSAHKEINLAIRYAIGKGFTTDGKGNFTWQGWTEALKRFGPGSKDPEYQNKINTMEQNSREPRPTDY